jgi:type II secretory ATPase GspE/PulE/Tfp pilus assembly ATPase PilB-like protein
MHHAPSQLPNALRKTLLLRLISKAQLSKEEMFSSMELMSAKVLESIHAQAFTLYLLEEESIAFKYIHYSPNLWKNNPNLQTKLEKNKEHLLSMSFPAGQGIVGSVIESGQSVFFNKSTEPDRALDLSEKTGFSVTSMLTVPLKGPKGIIGALQVVNKEDSAADNFFTQNDLAVLEEVAQYCAPLLRKLIDPAFQLSEKETAKFIAQYSNCPLVTDMDQIKVNPELISCVDAKIVRKTGIFPYKRLDSTAVAVLMVNPLDYTKREAFNAATALSVEEVVVVPKSLFDQIVIIHFKGDKSGSFINLESANYDELKTLIQGGFEATTKEDAAVFTPKSEDSAPMIQLTNRIIQEAHACGASDIHIEPLENEILVRYRVDGVCQDKLILPRSLANPLIARLKIMADLDITEKRLPQDGRIVFKKFTTFNADIDLRVATSPMQFGEKIVMRILDKEKSALPITSLGFSEENLEKYRRCIREPHGMILHCGPTGSGKSMTLFSALREIARSDINIQTAEDPVEYTIPGINQMQVNSQIGLTFARALRSFLRMDPDVILVGEIRDLETAEIATEAALTGHLLLSTLHTNDAASTPLRLIEMGIEPFLISSSLLVVCAQRLVRRVCQNCRVAYEPSSIEREILESAIGWSGTIYKTSEHGCPACNGLSYKGRMGIHELMLNTPEITAAINARASAETLKEISQQQGMKTLYQDALLKVREGSTTLLESLACVRSE